MKFIHPGLIYFQGKLKSFGITGSVGMIKDKSFLFFRKIKSTRIQQQIGMLGTRSQDFMEDIKSIGSTTAMDDYDKRKLSIFNLMNFFQLVTGILIPVSCLFGKGGFRAESFFVACLPAFVSFTVLCLNILYKYEAGMITYFILYPVITGLVYLNGMNLGEGLYFILYGILSVFFLQEITHMLFSVSLSMISYFILVVICKNYTYQLEKANLYFYLLNQVIAIVFIFYGLFLIKKENNVYQISILAKNQDLHHQNLEIQKQEREIAEKANLLEKQKAELTELNTLKNKLFSVIAHDLKAPMYALRNLFRSMQQQDLPASKIKLMIPTVVNELNDTTGLMENLLNWAKSQMQDGPAIRQEVELVAVVEETIRSLQLQADGKQIKIENKAGESCCVLTDRDMLKLVLRNLLSNSIKFTPVNGHITISLRDGSAFAEIIVQDTGVGISAESLKKIHENNYYTTKGTASESGTGLGLLLCKEFLSRNGGEMTIQSELGKGSIFSFSIPTV
jgi:two-component system, sensor histidine kinase and response regulator